MRMIRVYILFASLFLFLIIVSGMTCGGCPPEPGPPCTLCQTVANIEVLPSCGLIVSPSIQTYNVFFNQPISPTTFSIANNLTSTGVSITDGSYAPGLEFTGMTFTDANYDLIVYISSSSVATNITYTITIYSYPPNQIYTEGGTALYGNIVEEVYGSDGTTTRRKIIIPSAMPTLSVNTAPERGSEDFVKGIKLGQAGKRAPGAKGTISNVTGR